jgi:SNF2 family DNA or RNA helicase
MTLPVLVTYAGHGRVLATADDVLPRDVVAAARGLGGRRSGPRSLLMPAAVAAAVLTGMPTTWQPTAARAAENRQRIRRHARTVLAEAEALRHASQQDIRSVAAASSLAGILDDHQALNVVLMTIPNGWGACVFDEQGTGKTVSVIAAFDLLAGRNEIDRLIIVSPKSMVAEWHSEFARFTADLYQVATVAGTAAERGRALDGRSDVLVMNFEGVATQLDALVLAARRSRMMLVVDESYNIKNPEAVRTEAVAELREWCSRAYVLCGTPAPHSARDLVAQVNLVDCGYTFDTVRLSEDDDDLRAQVRAAVQRRTIFTRNLKSVVLPDLPDRTFSEVPVLLAPIQRRLYDEAVAGLTRDLEKVSDADFNRDRTSYVNRRASLLRLCTDPAGVDPLYTELPAKVAALDALLADLIVSRHEKVVLWSYYRNSLQLLSDRYATYGVARVDGSVTDNGERRDAVRRFQQDDDTRLFVGNPAAAGAGLTLHAARFAVYESLGAQAAHHMQSLDRIHRRGQQRSVEYVTLLAQDTIEQGHYQRLLDKGVAQGDLLGDPRPDHLTREVMLAQLLDGA